METTAADLKKIVEDEQTEVRSMVLDGVEQIKQGKTKDFNEVCDRLEEKYKDAVVQN